MVNAALRVGMEGIRSSKDTLQVYAYSAQRYYNKGISLWNLIDISVICCAVSCYANGYWALSSDFPPEKSCIFGSVKGIPKGNHNKLSGGTECIIDYRQ